jgi:hypothetical protein
LIDLGFDYQKESHLLVKKEKGMKRISRVFLFGALTLILLTACTGQDGLPTATVAEPTIPGDQTATPPPLGTDTASAATPALAGTVGVDLTATIPTSTNIEGAAAT